MTRASGGVQGLGVADANVDPREGNVDGGGHNPHQSRPKVLNVEVLCHHIVEGAQEDEEASDPLENKLQMALNCAQQKGGSVGHLPVKRMFLNAEENKEE